MDLSSHFPSFQSESGAGRSTNFLEEYLSLSSGRRLKKASKTRGGKKPPKRKLEEVDVPTDQKTFFPKSHFRLFEDFSREKNRNASNQTTPVKQPGNNKLQEKPLPSFILSSDKPELDINQLVKNNTISFPPNNRPNNANANVGKENPEKTTQKIEVTKAGEPAGLQNFMAGLSVQQQNKEESNNNSQKILVQKKEGGQEGIENFLAGLSSEQQNKEQKEILPADGIIDMFSQEELSKPTINVSSQFNDVHDTDQDKLIINIKKNLLESKKNIEYLNKKLIDSKEDDLFKAVRRNEYEKVKYILGKEDFFKKVKERTWRLCINTTLMKRHRYFGLFRYLLRFTKYKMFEGNRFLMKKIEKYPEAMFIFLDRFKSFIIEREQKEKEMKQKIENLFSDEKKEGEKKIADLSVIQKDENEDMDMEFV